MCSSKNNNPSFQQRTAARAADLRELPKPDPAAQAQSEALIQRIHTAIEKVGGKLPFARYMEMALYEPGLGYYSAGSTKFGEAGDFVTAPEISPLFSRCVARQAHQVLAALGEGDILELGAGSGVMAAEILLELARGERMPERYLILESSADLRDRQRHTIERAAPEHLARVYWLDSLPETPIRGVVLANEVLDAMPVHRFSITEHGAQELYVAWQDERFVALEGELSSQPLTAALQPIITTLAPSYHSEINLFAPAWINSLAAVLEQGLLLSFDYGFPRAEYYHPQRYMGTLMCHYRHRAHDDPFVYPGLQDITAHVDFTAVAKAGVAAGFDLAGYTTQSAFLLASGITAFAEDTDYADTAQHLATVQALKRLTLPSEMGELFKAIALSKGLQQDWLGFALADHRHRL